MSDGIRQKPRHIILLQARWREVIGNGRGERDSGDALCHTWIFFITTAAQRTLCWSYTLPFEVTIIL